jgi:hypothetical protein
MEPRGWPSHPWYPLIGGGFSHPLGAQGGGRSHPNFYFFIFCLFFFFLEKIYFLNIFFKIKNLINWPRHH